MLNALHVRTRLPRLCLAGGCAVRKIEDEDELCRLAAERIAEGKILGWFQGWIECGARVLGDRSILADPRRPDMREIINAKIKFREKFRPFAPSILEEAVHDYFAGAVPGPFMIQVYPVRPEERKVIPAVTHVDGSGRLQTVSRGANPPLLEAHQGVREEDRRPRAPPSTRANLSSTGRRRPWTASCGRAWTFLVLGSHVVEKKCEEG